MTALYIRESLSRRTIRRVLIVPPAGLVGNWHRELRLLFQLRFCIVVGSDAKQSNPFSGVDSDLVIVSLDSLRGSNLFNRLRDPSVQPYDLVVFDEAHKLSAYRDPDDTFRPTDRYRLAEAIAAGESAEPALDRQTHGRLSLGAHRGGGESRTLAEQGIR